MTKTWSCELEVCKDCILDPKKIRSEVFFVVDQGSPKRCPKKATSLIYTLFIQKCVYQIGSLSHINLYQEVALNCKKIGDPCCSRIGFCLSCKKVASCLLDLNLCGVKQESDCLCHVCTGMDLDGSGLKKFRVHTLAEWYYTKRQGAKNTVAAFRHFRL